MNTQNPTVYLNGVFMPLDEAKVPVLDRGHIFGEGIYEVIPVYQRRAFRLTEHLQRLEHSLSELAMPNPYSLREWQKIIEQLIDKAPWPDQSVYLQITRGADVIRHFIPAPNLKPSVFLMSNVLETPTAEQKMAGVTAISLEDIRWLRCDLKTTSLVANCWMRQQAVAKGCAEAVLFRQGRLTEGSSSSIFIVRQEHLYTPPKDRFILPGITYDVVLELAAAHGMPIEIGVIAEQDVRTADEVWLTSSTKEVLAIVTLDGKPVGNGTPGPLFKKMDGWFQDFKHRAGQA